MTASTTAASFMAGAIVTYLAVGYITQLSAMMQDALVLIAAVTLAVAAVAIIEVGQVVLGASAGALAAFLILHFVRLPTTEHDMVYHAVLLVLPAIALALMQLSCLHILIRLTTAFVGAFLFVTALSRLLWRMGLVQEAPLDVTIFLIPPLQGVPGPSTISYALVTLWLLLFFFGVVGQYHADAEYQVIEDRDRYAYAPVDVNDTTGATIYANGRTKHYPLSAAPRTNYAGTHNTTDHA